MARILLCSEGITEHPRSKEYLVNGHSAEGYFPEPNSQYKYDLEIVPLGGIDFDSVSEIDLKALWSSGKKNNSLSLVTYNFNSAETLK